MAFGITHVQNAFKRPRKMIPTTFASTTANAVSIISSTELDDSGKAYGQNFDITIYGISDGVYVTPLSTAPATTDAFLINSDVSLDLKVNNKLAIVSDSTTASYQAIIWEG